VTYIKYQPILICIQLHPNLSASAETDRAVSTQKTPPKRFVKQKTTDHVVDGQLSSSKGRKIIKKEK
jgi:hypothetical protein